MDYPNVPEISLRTLNNEKTVGICFMLALEYIAFQGFVDERMQRLIESLERHGWHVEVTLIHPSRGWIATSGGGRHVLVGQRIVSNPILNELFLVPLFLFVRYLFEFPRLRGRVRLLYVHNFPDSYALPFMLLARIFRISAAYEIRDPWKEFNYAETDESARSRVRFRFYFLLMSIIELVSISLASGFVFATIGLQELHSPQSNGKPMCIIRNQSDYSYTDEVLTHGLQIRRKLGLEDCFVVSYIGGGFQPYRGVDVLLESMTKISRRCPKVKLLIVGGHGEALAAVRRRIRDLGIQDTCEVTGWVPGQQLAYYYMASDVGIIPHRRTVATEIAVPNKFFDYLALGKPVIVSSLREISSLIEDGVSGLTVRPDDPEDLARAILELAENPELMKQISANAFKIGQKFTFASVEPAFLEFMSGLAERR